MANFIDTIIKNPILIDNAKEALSRYWIPALVATLGTGGLAAYMAGNKKRIGESPSARRKRIIRSTLLPTLAAALGSTGLIGASALWNTDADSYVGTGKKIDEGKEEVTKEDVREATKPPEPNLVDTVIGKYVTPSSLQEAVTGTIGSGVTLAGMKAGKVPFVLDSQRFNLLDKLGDNPTFKEKASYRLLNPAKKITNSVLKRWPIAAGIIGGYQLLGNGIIERVWDNAMGNNE